MEARGKPAEILIEGGDVVLPDRIVVGGTVALSMGTIRFSGSGGDAHRVHAAGRDALRIDARGSWICPALYETHIHGCGGAWTGEDFPGSLSAMGRFLARQGVGLFLPTTVSEECAIEGLGTALDALRADSGLTGRIPGIYVEGPFVAPARRAAIPAGCLREVSLDYLDRLYELSKGHLRVMTFAPELRGARELPGWMRERGILPALGHSDAAMADLEPYASEALLGVTHLFNGMSGVSHKAPGLAHWALLDRRVFTEIVGDGLHVHPSAMRLALQVRPADKMVLISDALAPAGLPEGEAASGTASAAASGTMYGRNVVSRGAGVYYEEDGTLVGSRLLVRDGLARLTGELGVPVPSAVAMASCNPARMLGLRNKGALLLGYDADVAVLSRDFRECSLCVWEGRILHRA